MSMFGFELFLMSLIKSRGPLLGELMRPPRRCAYKWAGNKRLRPMVSRPKFAYEVYKTGAN